MNQSKKPKISIIIPTKNEEKNIARLLKSIINSPPYNPNIIEIVVVDNPNTADQTREIVKSFVNVQLFVTGPERSSQRNFGAEKSNGEYIYFVDADMEFSNNLLETILQNLNESIALIVPERVSGKSLYCRAINIEKQIYDQNPIISAARVFLRERFLAIGGYNIDMISGEDWDLDRRYRRQENNLKNQVRFLNSFIYHHEEDLGFITSIKKKIYYAKQIKNYNIGIQNEVNPIYRLLILFSRPDLIITDILAFMYLVTLKFSQFGIGFLTYKFIK
jgi:glycosyltransferase involved in cell wall biosynthesis